MEMPWYCDNCGERVADRNHVCAIWRGGRKSRVKLTNVIATRVPPLDGFVRFNDDGSGLCRLEEREWNMEICKRGKSPKTTRGVRPPGWSKALERIGERAAAMIANGVDLPEC